MALLADGIAVSDNLISLSDWRYTPSALNTASAVFQSSDTLGIRRDGQSGLNTQIATVYLGETWIYRGNAGGSPPQDISAIEVVTYIPQTTYYMRGLDNNQNSFVYWSDLTPNILPSVTTPDLTGTLVNVCVVGTSTTNLSQDLEFDPDLADIYNSFKH